MAERTFLSPKHLVAWGLLASCVLAAEQPGLPRKMETTYLPNAVRVHPRVISGGLPEGDAAFEELRALGVRTVISVDGARPDVQRAREHGLRYVHLPHGYDGIPTARARELAKAVRDLEGPVYIHCHHGKHRSPAAASVACVTAGLLEPQRALGVLQVAGTSEHYRGLFQAASSARPLDPQTLADLRVEFPETAELPAMAEAMVAIEHTHDHLREIAEAGWRPPARHPDLKPAHEALLLREHFTELLRTDEAREQPEDFIRWLEASRDNAARLEKLLRQTAPDNGEGMLDRTRKQVLERITSDCRSCHRKYRDVPLEQRGERPPK